MAKTTSNTDDKQFHAVNLRLNRDIVVEKFISDQIRQDINDHINVSQIIKTLLYLHYSMRVQAEKVE
jgi:hypothetical protein